MRAAPQAETVGLVPQEEEGAEGRWGGRGHPPCLCSEVSQALPSLARLPASGGPAPIARTRLGAWWVSCPASWVPPFSGVGSEPGFWASPGPWGRGCCVEGLGGPSEVGHTEEGQLGLLVLMEGSPTLGHHPEAPAGGAAPANAPSTPPGWPGSPRRRRRTSRV